MDRAWGSSIRWIGLGRRRGPMDHRDRVESGPPMYFRAARLGSRPTDRRRRRPVVARRPGCAHPTGAWASNDRPIGFRRRGEPTARQDREEPNPPERAGTDRFGPRPAGRRRKKPGTGRFPHGGFEVRQIRVRKTPSPRTTGSGEVIAPRRLSVTRVVEAPGLPRCRRRIRAPRPSIVDRRAESRRKFPCRGGHGRGRRLRQQALERRQRPAGRQPTCNHPVVLRWPAPSALPPTHALMTRTYPTTRRST